MKKTILIVLILVIAIGVYYYFNRDTSGNFDTEQTEETEEVAGVSGWKLYNEEEFKIQFPPDYSFTYNFCLKDCTGDSIKGSSDLYVRVDKEQEGGIGCHYGLCSAPVESSKEFNGITWQYLGFNSYTDVGQTANFYVYRTTQEGYRYYISFNEDTPVNEVIVSTFGF